MEAFANLPALTCTRIRERRGGGAQAGIRLFTPVEADFALGQFRNVGLRLHRPLSQTLSPALLELLAHVVTPLLTRFPSLSLRE